MDDLKQEIIALLDKFTTQCVGYPLSEFAMIALRGLVVQKIEEHAVRNRASYEDQALGDQDGLVDKPPKQKKK